MRKCPEHSETLGLRGLFLHHLGRKDEAYQAVKAGLKANLKSASCWHFYGILYKLDKNYEEALKCYKTSIRMDGKL